MNPRINDCYKMLIIKVFLWINIFCCLTLNTNAENIDIESYGRIIQKSTAEVFISEGTITIPVDLFYDNIMEVLHIPSTCTCIDYFGSEGSSLRMIFVDKDNQIYASKNGLLLSKDESILFFCPPSYKDKTLTIPNTVRIIESGCFENSVNIRHLIIPDSVELIEGFAFESSKLEEITILGNKTCFSIDAFNYCPKLRRIWVIKGSLAETILLTDCDYIDLREKLYYLPST